MSEKGQDHRDLYGNLRFQPMHTFPLNTSPQNPQTPAFFT